ncbi:Ig-like domain-containing protein [Blautia sp. Marseille-P2398]|uniref:Ig-like domain-containing protein n=1 Tax=Blautia sp. Marseille-P2398 TaxID=1805476 RepID=UPI0035684860
MKKKCFKKTVSWALSIVMSATMAVTPVLADTFTDDSQSIISGNAEIPAVDVESDTNCGDTMGDSDCIEKELTEFQDPLFMEEDYGDAESARFSSGNDAEVVSDFYDDSVPAAQTEEKAVVYLDPTRGNNNNTGESDTAAVQTLSKALGLVAQNGVIYLLNPVTVDSQMTLSNVTFRPGKSNMLGMLYISGDVTLNNIKIYNETPDGRSCQFSNDPIRVTGTLTIGKGTRIESFLGKSCIYVSQGTLNLNGGKIQGDTQNTVKHGGEIYAKNATVNVYEGIISGHSATYGGGIYADNSSININGGQIIDSQATKGGGIYANGGNVYINGGRISGHRATYGGGIYLDQASIYIKEGGINDNQATKGGAIYTEGTKAGSCLLNIEGGTISDNCANESGAGIFAICSKGTRDDMKVEIFGGTIAHNYSGTGENLEENAIVLMGEDPNLTEDTGFADLYLSGSPVITGSVTLADDYCAADSKNYSPLIHVDDSFNVNKPILVSPIYGDDPDTSVVIYDSESIAKNYQSHFCSKEGSNRELVKKGATLKWVVKVNVRLRTFADITAFPVLNPEKSIYLIKGEKVSPNDVPKAAVIPGYVRTGWLNVSDNTTWDPASEITDNMIVREVWALVKPIVQVSADKEKGCPSSKIVLTAKATHVLDDKGITYSYQWYKDNQTLDGQTGGTLTVSEAGTYKVEVTATSQAGATSKETASIVIPAFEHSYSWQSDKTNHWKHCSIGNEDTAQEAHQFDGWTVIKQASIGVEGEKERNCKVCGYKETATIPAIYIPSYPVTGIKVSPDTLTLNRKDETAQLTAEVIPSYADNTRVKWKSSDENVVTVDEKGKVTAVGNGTATITVTSVSGNYTATVAVTVKIPVEIEKISIEAEKETLTKLGESTELKVKIEPENADAQKLIWKSENEMIAAVDENGKVTAIGNGMAIITVTTEDGKNTASITITVKIPDEPVINKTKGFGRLKVRSVNQTKTSITLEWSKLDGVDGYLVYGNRCNTNTKTYKYQKLATITNGRTWTHKNLKKGTFYKYIVKAYKIVDGKKVVTDTSVSIHVITQGSKYGIAKSVSVTKIGNKKNVSKITLKKGKTAQITAKEIKKDKKIRHHRKLCYESCNTAVATVTPEGLIQAVGKGTCTIWVYAQNGVYVALTVTVK